MPSQDTIQKTLIEALQAPGPYPHAVDRVTTLQTHISIVLLAGDYAYKLKKPLNLGFLDFSTLDLRRHYCEEELRLNGRLAPQLYLDVVAFTGSPEAPVFSAVDTPGAFEYAVKMRRFDQEGLLDRVLARGELDAARIEAIARMAARFHAEAAVADADSEFGSPGAVLAPMTQNFAQLRERLEDTEALARIGRIETWTLGRHEALRDTLAARKAGGFIRECHGDMHLGNIALIDGEIAIFDGIEFNASLRWIDVISEIAFLIMDLEDRGAAGLSHRALNSYLEQSGDYGGLALLRFYQVYRAMVRAKVASIRLDQPGLDRAERDQTLATCRGYLALAERYTRPGKSALLLTCGASGSGKSTVARWIVENTGAVQIRSDVERKRLFGLDPLADSHSGLGSGLYTPQANERTYARLLELSESILESGFTAVVDATFLKRDQRRPFRALAERLALPFRVLRLEDDPDVLGQRIDRRKSQASDASEATREVLNRQLETAEWPDRKEPTLDLRGREESGLEELRTLLVGESETSS